MVLLTPRPVRWRAIVSGAGLALGLTIPVAVLAYLVRAEVGPVVGLDEAAIAAGTDYVRDRPGLREVLVVWQEAFNARWVNLAGSLLCLWVWRRHGLASRAAWAFVTLMIAWGLGLGVKFVVQRARPVVEDAVSHAPGYSFPSGHATNTAVAAITLTLLVWPLLRQRGRAAVLIVAAVAVVVTGVDRVLLGVHYPSDVVAGVALGAAMASGSYVGYARWHPPGDVRAGPTPLASAGTI